MFHILWGPPVFLLPNTKALSLSDSLTQHFPPLFNSLSLFQNSFLCPSLCFYFTVVFCLCLCRVCPSLSLPSLLFFLCLSFFADKIYNCLLILCFQSLSLPHCTSFSCLSSELLSLKRLAKDRPSAFPQCWALACRA
jgi:hypothetical protein